MIVSARAIFLNTETTGDIVGVDFGKNLPSEDARKADAALKDKDVGIVAFGQWDGPNPLSLTLHATKFYVRVVHGGTLP